MASPQYNPDITGMLLAAAISALSGAVSIGKRILSGTEGTLLWVFTEFCTAILCGYLMYNAYPALAPHLPNWLTLPVAVAFAAHSGGRVFQEAEEALMHYFNLKFKQ